MNVTKTLSTAGIGAAIIVGSMLAVNLASAYGGVSEEQKAERVSSLAERFNLDETEVQSYFDEQKAERQTEREEKRAEFVAGLVSEGTLTQEQADELSELKDGFNSEVEALKATGAEREDIKTLMQENRDAVEAWAEAEGLDLDSIRSDKGKGHKGHRSGHGPHNVSDDSSEIESSSIEL